MRAILLVLILVIVAAIVLLTTGLVDINTVRGARAPDVDASRSGVTASGGQAPAFEVETGTVAVGKRETTVNVPTLEVRKPGGNEAAPAPAPANTTAPAQ